MFSTVCVRKTFQTAAKRLSTISTSTTHNLSHQHFQHYAKSAVALSTSANNNFKFTQSRNDARVEMYDNNLLSKYNLTHDYFYQNCYLPFHEDTMIDYIIRFKHHKESILKQNRFDSLHATLLKSLQKTYMQRSIAPDTQSKYGLSKSFICFYKGNLDNNNNTDNATSTGAATDNGNINGNDDDYNGWDYAATMTMCQPDENDKLGIGYHDINDSFKYMKPAFTKGHEILGYKTFWKDVMGTLAYVEINKKLFLRDLAKILKHFWWVEMVSTNINIQSKGIGSYMFNNVINQYVNNKSNEYGYNGFICLTTTNPNAVRFYQKNGFRLITTLKFPTKINDLGENVDLSMFMMVYHKDTDLLDKTMKKLDNVFDEYYKPKTLLRAVGSIALPSIF